MAETDLKTNGKQEAEGSYNQGSKQVTRGSQPIGLSRRESEPLLMSPSEFFNLNPFAVMRRMTEEMDRLFGDAVSSPGQNYGSTWSPAIELSERGGNYVVHAELPGLKPEDVKVEVINDAVSIRGERKSRQEENKGGVHRSERRYGKFYRSIALPAGTAPDKIYATFEDGVLEITIPIPAEQSNRRQIPIETSGSGLKEKSQKA